MANVGRRRSRFGPWAVITGASDGIGRAFADALAAERVDLVLVARRGDALNELAATLRREHGIATHVIAADLGTSAGIAEVLQQTAPLTVGLLVAAAGFGSSGDFVDAPIAEELAMIDVNCRAVVALSHAFGARFAAQRRGGLVLLSSLLAFQGVPRAATYAATKAFVQSFAEGLRRELAPAGVEVIASAPGPITSGFGRRADMQMGMGQTPDVVAKATLDALGRVGTVRPGWLSKLLELSLSFLPRWGRVRMLAVIMRGMTKHKLAAPVAGAPRLSASGERGAP